MSAATPVLHYAGELLCRSGKQGSLHILPGWAACCYGPRAEKIRRERRNTRDRALVTCRACLRVMAREIQACGNCGADTLRTSLAAVSVPWSGAPLRFCPACVERGVASGVLSPRGVA